jgi:hypothetical protein
MSRDDEECLRLGREIIRMIHDVRKVAKEETGYARRKFTYPGGEVHIIVANDARLADIMDQAASKAFQVTEATPPSAVN